MAKKLPKDKIEQAANAVQSLTAREQKIFDFAHAAGSGGADGSSPYVVLKYFRDAFECFSDWERDELKLFTELIKDLRNRTWRQVLETSSKSGGKRGLAYTPYDIDKVPSDTAKDHLKAVKNQISEEISFFELRVDQNKLRVHGFRSKTAFFLVLLDREHRVWPM